MCERRVGRIGEPGGFYRCCGEVVKCFPFQGPFRIGATVVMNGLRLSSADAVLW